MSKTFFHLAVLEAKGSVNGAEPGNGLTRARHFAGEAAKKGRKRVYC
jgi:hypothetical protein